MLKTLTYMTLKYENFSRMTLASTKNNNKQTIFWVVEHSNCCKSHVFPCYFHINLPLYAASSTADLFM